MNPRNQTRLAVLFGLLTWFLLENEKHLSNLSWYAKAYIQGGIGIAWILFLFLFLTKIQQKHHNGKETNSQ